MLSGDRKGKCESAAAKLGIETVYSEQLPDEKLKVIEYLQEKGLVAMVGDGINDAPALAKADVGISLSAGTSIARNSAQIILLGNQMNQLRKAFEDGILTYKTIKQNLFWAFFYNVVAIPIAAVGLLSPMVAALTMAFSDVIVVGNSLLLRFKKF